MDDTYFLPREKYFRDTDDNTLAEGKITKSGNFKLKKKITSIDELLMILKRDKSIFARHRLYPSAFYLSWHLRMIDSWINMGFFWEIERIDKGRLIDIIDTTNEPNILNEKK